MIITMKTRRVYDISSIVRKRFYTGNRYATVIKAYAAHINN